MNDCIFCKIVKGEIPAYKIVENDKFLAFLDICQFTPGHTLVIPKNHHRFIWDIPSMDEYFQFIKEIGNHFRSLGYEYVDTISMGRMVPHAHVHVIPHDGNNKDWNNGLKGIFNLQHDEKRRPNAKKFESIQEKFQMN
jgi:histidine triad (HIT) family protein